LIWRKAAIDSILIFAKIRHGLPHRLPASPPPAAGEQHRNRRPRELQEISVKSSDANLGNFPAPLAFVNVVLSTQGASMRTIMLAVAAATVAFTAAPMLGELTAKAEGIQTAQVDVQVGPNRDRDRDRDIRRDRDRDLTVGVGPGGVRIGPRERCRMVTTTVEREGRTITTRERKCD
jgi:hypothetical protein